MDNKKTKIVETFDGTKALRKDCRYISGQFYLKDKQCFLMEDNKWHRINNGLIEYDHELKKWILKSQYPQLTLGVVKINEDETFVYGRYSSNLVKNALIYDRTSTIRPIISEDVIDKSLFTEDLKTGIFIPNSLFRGLNSKGIIRGYSFKLYYIFEHLYDLFKDKYDKYFKYQPNQINFSKELGETTFGVEFETNNGQIPERHCLRTGLIPLKDGSLRHDGIEPYEYTTIPLQGEKGLYTLKEHTELLNKYCTNSIDCSLHIHIGNYGRSPEYIISLYRTLLSIQEDIYSIFPKLTRKTSLFKSKGKDYCNPLDDLNFTKNIKSNLNKIFGYLTGYYFERDGGSEDGWEESTNPDILEISLENNEVTSTLNESINESIEALRREVREEIRRIPTPLATTRKPPIRCKHNYLIGMAHPHDPSNGDSKWQVNYRYKLVNLIPLLFGTRGTVEFRTHTITFNKDKVINWLYICNAICKYAFINRDNIAVNGTKVSLEEIIDLCYSTTLSQYLNSYIKYRTNLMIECSKQEDHIGIIDIERDNLSKWDYPLKSLI